MKDFVILPDVNCDLNPIIREKYNLEYIPGHIIWPDGSDTHAFLDWKDCTYYENCTSEFFYKELKKNPDAFKTSPPNVQEYYNAFEKAINEGKDVLSMSISSGISGAYNFSLTAREQILEKYPDANIVCFDSLRYGPGFGLIVYYAAEMRAQGKSLTEVVEYIEKNKMKFHQMGWLDDLSFVAKKGRITPTKAFFGTLIGIKSLGEMDYNGLVTVIGKAKGEKAAYAAIMEYIENTIENPEDQVIFIAQTNRKAQAEVFKTMIEEKFHPKAIYINEVFPSCGINVGPGLMTAYYYGKEITKGLVDEKALIEKILSK